MGKWNLKLLLMTLCLLSFILSGCGYHATKKEIATVERMVSELKASEGDKLVPYEYCSAESFLQVSKYRFAENNFKQARIFLGRAKSAAETGLKKVKGK